jgi:hypothetical protein
MSVQRMAALLGFLTLAVGAVLGPAVGAENTDQGNIFPPGKYVLGGAEKPARGEDVFELKKPFRLRPGQFILSGGPNPTDPIVVDDDLEVSSGDKLLFIDDDHVKSTETRSVYPCTYSGAPIILVLKPNTKLRIKAIDHVPNDAGLGELYLHRHDGSRRRLTERIEQQSNAVLPHTFFDQEFALDDGFKRPSSTTYVIEMPAIPASLLPKK